MSRSTMVSPSSSIRNLTVPWVAGCDGPMLRIWCSVWRSRSKSSSSGSARRPESPAIAVSSSARPGAAAFPSDSPCAAGAPRSRRRAGCAAGPGGRGSARRRGRRPRAPSSPPRRRAGRRSEAPARPRRRAPSSARGGSSPPSRGGRRARSAAPRRGSQRRSRRRASRRRAPGRRAGGGARPAGARRRSPPSRRRAGHACPARRPAGGRAAGAARASRSPPSALRPPAARRGDVLAAVLAAQELEAALEQGLGDEEPLLVVEHRVAVVGRGLHLAAHPDRLLGAGLLTEAAEHAARHVDVEGLGVALDAGARELARHDADAVGRAGELAEPAGDALGLAVVELHQHGHAPEGVGEVDALLGILDDEVGAALAGDEAAQVAEEMAARDREALHDHRDVEALEPAEVLLAPYLDDPTGHARHYRGWALPQRGVTRDSFAAPKTRSKAPATSARARPGRSSGA